MPSTRIEDYDPLTLYFTSNFEDHEGIRHPEDGERMIDTVYFVQAEAPNGVRWRRECGASEWRTGKMCPDEDGWEEPHVYRSYDPKALEELADNMAKRLTESKTRRLNPEVWWFEGCVYGSDAYQQLDMEGELRDWEERSELERF